MNLISEKFIVSNHIGEKLVGILQDTGSKEIVIICHGLNSSKDCKLIANLASSLGQRGLSSFRFDFSGNGESEGDFQFGNYYKEVEDLHAVVLYWILKQREVKAIIGHSKGGSTVLLYASKHKEVSTIVNVSGRLDLKDGLKERFGENFEEKIEASGFLDVKDPSGDGKSEFRITKDSLKERISIDLRKAVKMIPKDVRVLTVHGSEDKAVAVDNAFGCDQIIENHTLRIINGADHMYSQHERDLQETVISFIQGKA